MLKREDEDSAEASMTNERELQKAEYKDRYPSPGQQRGGLLALLRRAIAPRAPVVLVMERDGRLVCARVRSRG